MSSTTWTRRSLLRVYGNWRSRFIPQRPREVHISRELQQELDASPPWAAKVATVLDEIRRGENLEPRLSTRVDVAYLPPEKRRRAGPDVDVQLAHDGLHHLHIGEHVPGKRFVERGNDLLFAAFKDTDAFVIGVYRHGAWGRRDLLERLVRNWPEADLIPRLEGLRASQPDPTDEERWQMMKAGLTVFIEIDGAVYAPLGQSLAGTPIDVTDRVNEFIWNLEAIREEGLDAVVTRRGGDPRLYWNPCVVDNHIGLRSSQGFIALGQLA